MEQMPSFGDLKSEISDLKSHFLKAFRASWAAGHRSCRILPSPARAILTSKVRQAMEGGGSGEHFLPNFALRPGNADSMLIGRVIGDVVATQKDASHRGRKILVVQPLQLDGSDRGEPVLALDAVDAGVGDRVLLATEGFSAMTAVGRPNSPIDMAVLGVIDHVELIEGVR